jgi:aminopeptidase N
MFQNVLGENTWERGLHHYLSDNALTSANSSHLYNGLQKAIDEAGTGNIEIARFMGSWETQRGYPVVHVEWSNDELILSQERFLYSNETSTSLW